MATPQACAALVDVFPDVLRLKRAITTTASATPATAVLVAVQDLQRPRVSELAEHLHLDLSTVSRQVTHLRQRHLLDACADPTDGRSQRLSVTEEGLAELRRSRRAMVAELAQHLADWDDTDVDALTTLLSRLSRSAVVAAPIEEPITAPDASQTTPPPPTVDSAFGDGPDHQLQESA